MNANQPKPAPLDSLSAKEASTLREALLRRISLLELNRETGFSNRGSNINDTWTPEISTLRSILSKL